MCQFAEPDIFALKFLVDVSLAFVYVRIYLQIEENRGISSEK